MKFALFFTVVALLIGCATSKNNSSTGSEGTATDGEIEGVVRVNYKGCGTLIEIKGNDGEKKLLYPANMDETMISEGLKILFTYIPSRVAVPSECAFADQSVAIDNLRKK
ncbi:MAG: hypothetical protein ACK45H_04040 [Bacteroidota bacterium]